jgi:hypothetical protein
MERFMNRIDPESSTTPASLPEKSARLALFGPAPLIEGEDPAAYDELLARICAAVNPANILEEIWVRDVVDLVWEALRLRRLKAKLMIAAAYRGLERVLDPLVDWTVRDNLVEGWVAREPNAVEQVDKVLASAGWPWMQLWPRRCLSK